MTISQALRRVKQLKGKMGELTARAASVVSHLSSETPKFNFADTRGQIAAVREELVTLEARVAHANATAAVDYEGKLVTIAEAIRRLQEFKAEIAWLGALSLRDDTQRAPELDYDDKGAPVRKMREVTYVTALTEPNRVTEVDALRDRFQKLNDVVETANHTTVVPE